MRNDAYNLSFYSNNWPTANGTDFASKQPFDQQQPQQWLVIFPPLVFALLLILVHSLKYWDNPKS